MSKVLRFPDGEFYNIEGIDPKEAAEVYSKMQQQISSLPPPEPEAPPQGITGRTLDLLGSGFSELLGSTAEGIQTLADPQAGDTRLRQFAERRRESARETQFNHYRKLRTHFSLQNLVCNI